MKYNDYKIKCLSYKIPDFECRCVDPMAAMLAMQNKFYASYLGPYINAQGMYALISTNGSEVSFEVLGPPAKIVKPVVESKQPKWNVRVKAKGGSKVIINVIHAKSEDQARFKWAKEYSEILDVIELVSITPDFMEDV